ncbi:acetate/propionate family kinase [Microbacterium sp. MPKO10]|uniref:acetate/propionate family kinase n=1 Tax=Microbacterium sp. MPKO10 TaxID=2989818 RepID=UPI002236B0F4|nr:acetate kinase [Microbacterium sp. MPKO10]MCW4458684.1 acetate kinase [Microbacterium sp. MPKO10]
MTAVLVINSGSSSFKYQLIEMVGETTLARGLVERIGSEDAHVTHEVIENGSTEKFEQTRSIPNHTEGFAVMLGAFTAHGPSLDEHPPVAVGHRVVHGGARFFEPTVVTDLVKINIQDLSELAPLHNPANVDGITAAQESFPDVPHVVVFDTAFHQTLPPAAYTYALDAETAKRYRVRKYGFHGTSHKFVSEEAARFLGRENSDLNQIVLHLGNGASMTAVRGGESVETSMGLTPLEGLVMGTRTGDIDPAVAFHLHRRADIGVAELDDLFNKRSGIYGLSGLKDMRDLTVKANAGDATARAALDVYVHRLKQYLGGYFFQLGRVDTIIFTAGIGENSVDVRAETLAGLENFGVNVDAARNEQRSDSIRVISTDDSPVTVLVVPTNEELEIARQTLSAV